MRPLRIACRATCGMRQGSNVISMFSRMTVAAVGLSLALGGSVAAESGAGAYLAGRQALYTSDFEAAATFYGRALARDRDNPALMENLVLSQLALGRVDRALPVARLMEEQELRSQAAHMVVAAHLIDKGEYDVLLDRDRETLGIGPLVDGLVAAWAQLGTGNRDAAMTAFDAVASENGLRSFALYHKALALASVGDFEGAEAIFNIVALVGARNVVKLRDCLC